MQQAHRRLAAILAADVVGYSRLMGADEEGTIARLKQLRDKMIKPKIAHFHGRVVGSAGDSLLVEFASAVDAVQCAVELQEELAGENADLPEDRRMIFRIGVNLGDVIPADDTIHGDGVNIASRLEKLAEPGGVCIGRNVYDQVRGKLGYVYVDLGEQRVHNIPEPVHAYHVSSSKPAEDATLGLRTKDALPLPNKPSIAVLPFANMGADAEQGSFADGLTEDLITDLSRNAGLFVIARSSTFAYKGKSVDVRSIARNLGVRYLLEGSARRASGRMRINVQLIDAISGGHMWAERFDRDLKDIFAVQDEVTARIVEVLVGRLVKLPPRNRPKSMDAYDLCVRARPLMEQSPDACREARMLLERAIAFDPDYAEAHGLLAQCLWLSWAHFGAPENPNRSLALALAERAVSLDPNDARCRATLALVLAFEFKWTESDAEFAAALALDSNQADAWANLSDISTLSGRINDGLDQIRRALRLNPHPESWYYLLLGQAQYAARDYEAAVKTLRSEETYRTNARKFLAASLAQLGRMEEARQEAELFLVSHPHFTITHWATSQPIRDGAVRDHIVEGYRKAGLPE